ncbi:MAG TPA: hypothetical protein VH814_20595 [Steroidobacteraceae bacterium]
MRLARHDRCSLDALSIAIFPAAVQAGSEARVRKGRELARGDAVGMYELDVQDKRYRIAASGLPVGGVPFQTTRRMSGKSGG